MTVFVDTSGVYALLDRADAGHERAIRARDSLSGEQLVTHSYVVVELVSLVRRRLGADAAARIIDEFLPALQVIDIDAGLRERSLGAFLAGVASEVSLVDRTSFEVMRDLGISRAFALDADFERAGFELVT